jgi:RimJ/RimL family protein N-acetyltransferase
VIEAGYVTLRQWEPADAAFVFDACQDDEIQRWTDVPRPYTALDAAAFVDRHGRPQPEEAGAWFAMTRTDNGELLGSICFDEIDWAFRSGKASYWVAAESRQQGAASASLAALAAWGFAELGLVEASVDVARGNAVSRRVAERAGFLFSRVAGPVGVDGDHPDDRLRYVRLVTQ